MKEPRAKRPATRNPNRATATPASQVVDNRIDFTSEALREAIQQLGISLVGRRTRSPLRKPEIERAFKGLCGRFENVSAATQTPSHSNVEQPK